MRFRASLAMTGLVALGLVEQPSVPGAAPRLKLYVLKSLSDDMNVIDVQTSKILRTVKVGKEPHGLASPSAQDVLYVSNEAENSLTTVDTRTDEVKDKFMGLGNRPNEIEVTPDG